MAKDVEFGQIRVLPDGRVGPRRIEGVDWGLIVRPFHQKGAAVSIRSFTNNAMNQHHGMQSVERFGAGVDAGDYDPYGHRGDLATLTEAIYFHGGAARVQRDTLFALCFAQREAQRDDIIEFLKTVQLLPR